PQWPRSIKSPGIGPRGLFIRTDYGSSAALSRSILGVKGPKGGAVRRSRVRRSGASSGGAALPSDATIRGFIGGKYQRVASNLRISISAVGNDDLSIGDYDFSHILASGVGRVRGQPSLFAIHRPSAAINKRFCNRRFGRRSERQTFRSLRPDRVVLIS